MADHRPPVLPDPIADDLVEMVHQMPPPKEPGWGHPIAVIGLVVILAVGGLVIWGATGGFSLGDAFRVEDAAP